MKRLTESQKRGLAVFTAAQGKKMVRAILAQGIRKSEIARRLELSPAQVTKGLRSIREGRATLRTIAKFGLAVGIVWDLTLVAHKKAEGR